MMWVVVRKGKLVGRPQHKDMLAETIRSRGLPRVEACLNRTVKRGIVEKKRAVRIRQGR